MSALHEATSKCWCSSTKRKFGIVVISESGAEWMVRHAFLCSDHYVDASSEAKGTINRIDVSDNYNGCKHCGNKGLVQCEGCKEYSCFRSGGISPIKFALCGKCGMRGVVAGIAKSMNISGD